MLTMPAPDQEAIDDRERIAADLARLVAPASVIAAPAALRAYESDGLTAYRQPPLVAVLPANDTHWYAPADIHCCRLSIASTRVKSA